MMSRQSPLTDAHDSRPRFEHPLEVRQEVVVPLAHLPPITGAISPKRPDGSMSIRRVRWDPLPSAATVNVVVGRSLPMEKSKTTRRGGSYPFTVTVPPVSPIVGSIVISNVEPSPTGSLPWRCASRK